MPLSWNEIKDRARAFSKEWEDGVYKSRRRRSALIVARVT